MPAWRLPAGKAGNWYTAEVVKLVDTPVLGTGVARLEGSSPSLGTLRFSQCKHFVFLSASTSFRSV